MEKQTDQSKSIRCKPQDSNGMPRRDFIRNSALVAAAVSFSPFGSISSPGAKRPNILYILADQWRASAFGYTGDPNVSTPNIDRLSRESINLCNAVSVCPVCTPHRASLMTGRYPTTTGMFLNDAHLPDDELCIAEVLDAAAYQTAYIGKWHLDGHGRKSYIPPERRQGFQYWKGAECDHDYNQSHYYTGNSSEKKFWEGYDVFAQTNDARQYINSHARNEEPFALFLSYGTPHFPHETAPQEYKDHYPPDKIKLPPNVPDGWKSEAQKEAQGYYAHCEALDKSIGDLLATVDSAGLRENTIVIFTSDHGEMLGSQNVRPKMKQVPWNESAGVPFLLRYPVIHGAKGRVVQMPVSTPDIFPTLLGLAGVKIPSTVEGEDLSSWLKKGKEKSDRASLYMSVSPFIQGDYAKEYRAIRTSRYTYVRSLQGPWLLYDNQADPFQMDNLVLRSENNSLVNELDRKLQAELKKIGDDFRPRSWYLDEWGYKPAPHGSVPYAAEDLGAQTPVRRKKP